MSALDNVVAAMTKSKGPAATIHRSELEEVIQLARIGEETAKAFRESNSGCPSIDSGFDQHCDQCPLTDVCDKVNDYKEFRSVGGIEK